MDSLAPMISDGGSGDELIVQQPPELNGSQCALRAWVAWKSIDEAFLKGVKPYATRP